MALIHYRRPDSTIGEIRTDRDGRLEVTGPGLPPPGYTTIYYPWEIEFDTPGDDGRVDAWRYITPGTSTYNTLPVEVGHLEEVAMYVIFGGASSAVSANARFFGAGTGGMDWRNAGVFQINGAGADADTVTLATGNISRVLVASTANSQPSSNVTCRLFVPQYVFVQVQTAVALVPVTVYIVGR